MDVILFGMFGSPAAQPAAEPTESQQQTAATSNTSRNINNNNNSNIAVEELKEAALQQEPTAASASAQEVVEGVVVAKEPSSHDDIQAMDEHQSASVQVAPPTTTSTPDNPIPSSTIPYNMAYPMGMPAPQMYAAPPGMMMQHPYAAAAHAHHQQHPHPHHHPAMGMGIIPAHYHHHQAPTMMPASLQSPMLPLPPQQQHFISAPPPPAAAVVAVTPTTTTLPNSAESVEERMEMLRQENASLEQELFDLKASKNEEDSQQVLANLRDGLKEADQNLQELQDRAKHTFLELQQQMAFLRNQIQVKTSLAAQYEQELSVLTTRHAAVQSAQERNESQSVAASAQIANLKTQNQSRDMKLADLKIQLDRVNNRLVINSQKRSSKGQLDPSGKINPEFIPLQAGSPLFPYTATRRDDPVDTRLEEIFNGIASHVKVTRINQGLYMFGHLQCELKIINSKMLVKVEAMEQQKPAWNFCKFGHFERFLSFIENECYGKLDPEEC